MELLYNITLQVIFPFPSYLWISLFIHPSPPLSKGHSKIDSCSRFFVMNCILTKEPLIEKYFRWLCRKFDLVHFEFDINVNMENFPFLPCHPKSKILAEMKAFCLCLTSYISNSVLDPITVSLYHASLSFFYMKLKNSPIAKPLV